MSEKKTPKEIWDYWSDVDLSRADLRKKKIPDGQPCHHPGCLSHVTHPCEGCGRIAGYTPLLLVEDDSPLPEDDELNKQFEIITSVLGGPLR